MENKNTNFLQPVINLYFNSLKFYFIDPETDLVLN
jgi:hypothetical protein